MFRRLLQVSRGNSFFLFGARGTGKTTYIGEAFDPDAALYLDLLDPEVEDRYRRSPGRLDNEVRALPAAVEWILIDEVQRAPRLLDVVHRLIEGTGKRFVLTGSSGRKLRRGASNLLAGRAFVYNLYPLTVPELQNAFVLDDALHWGTLPRILLPGRQRGETRVPARVCAHLPEGGDRRRTDHQTAGSVPGVPGGGGAVERYHHQLRQHRP